VGRVDADEVDVGLLGKGLGAEAGQRAVHLGGGAAGVRRGCGGWRRARRREPYPAPSPFAGTSDMARSASAVMVSEGLTPGLADTAAPSTTQRPS